LQLIRAADGVAGLWHLDSEEIKIIELNHAQDLNNKFLQSSDVTSLTWNVRLNNRNIIFFFVINVIITL